MTLFFAHFGEPHIAGSLHFLVCGRSQQTPHYTVQVHPSIPVPQLYENDERNNDCTKHFIQLVHVLKPKKSVSFENVTGILAKDNIHYLQMLVLELIQLGFNGSVQVLNSARCGGDAQERNRVFVTAWRCELSNSNP